MAETRQQLIGDLFEKIRCLCKDFSKGKGHLFEEHKLSRSEGEILFIVAHEERGVSASFLAKSLNVTHGAITQFIDSMITKGLIIKEHDTQDKRSVRIKLSEKAIEDFKTFERTHFYKISQIFDELDNDEIRMLSNLLGKIKPMNHE
jgi:DNA-binding MarR family transcriptional regulator